MKTFTIFLFAALLLFSSQHKAMATEDEPAIILTTNKSIGNELKVKLSFTSLNKFHIDWGDGTKQEYTPTPTGEIEYKANISGSNIKIYGDNIQTLNCQRQELSAVDVSNCPQLYVLKVSNNDLVELNLENQEIIQIVECSSNKLKKLTIVSPKAYYINCPHNQLSELNLKGLTGLQELYCNNNELQELELADCENLIRLICSFNQIKKLNNLSVCEDLSVLSCKSNQLTTLNVVPNWKLKQIFCTNNQLSTFTFKRSQEYTSIEIGNNNLTYKTLPNPTRVRSYKYSPQRTITLPQTAKTGEAIDLSSAYVEVSGHQTQYSWYVNDVQLNENVDYKIEKGITTFLKVPTGPVKCIMSHNEYQPLELETTFITISLPTAVDEQSAKPTTIYYHNNQVHVTTNEPGQYQVYSLSGACVQSGTLTSGNNSFAINGKGVYIVKTECKQIVNTQKISAQ